MMKKIFAKVELASFIPIVQWLPHYRRSDIRWDLVAGITLAFFVLPESMAYATLAGVPTYYGIYCCLAGGLFFALFTTAKHVAVGPTSSISLMIGSTVAVLSGGDLQRWAQIAELTALAVAGICFVAYIFRLSSLINFISDSILLGFKAGAALSIMATQLPKLFGLHGSGSNFFSRMGNLFSHLPETNLIVLVFGLVALAVLIVGDIFFHGKPISLLVVIASVLVISFTHLSSHGVEVTGAIPNKLPTISRPSLRLGDIDGVVELAFACFLMGYIETVSAARTFAMKNNYVINPQQELLALGASNFAAAFSSAYVVSGGLSQSTVNEASGAKTPLSLIVCSASLALILLFLAGYLGNLPEVILAVIVLHAVSHLIKIKELKRIYTLNKMEFVVAMIALCGVLLVGILKGVMLAVVMSLVLLIRKLAYPQVPILGKVRDTPQYSDISRHPDNTVYAGISIQRVESSILYFNAENIHEKINKNMQVSGKNTRLLVLDFSAVPFMDIAGSSMLKRFCEEVRKSGITVKLSGALSNVRDLLRKQGVEEYTGHISRAASIDEVVEEFNSAPLNIINQKN
jgi:SulP family sulfate permease